MSFLILSYYCELVLLYLFANQFWNHLIFTKKGENPQLIKCNYNSWKSKYYSLDKVPLKKGDRMGGQSAIIQVNYAWR